MEVTIVELISSLGFPIAACLALAFFVWNIYKQSVVREEKLMSEITENRLINKQFADIIAKYDIKLDKIETDVEDIKSMLYSSNADN